jgi:TrwC relaxase
VNSIGILHCGREYYYLKLGKDDYYTNKEEPQGIFYGKGAAHLGLQGEAIEHNDVRLKKLFQGINPTNGESLRKGAYTVKQYEQYVYTDPESGKKQTFKSKAQIPDELKAAVTTETKQQKGVIGYDNVFSAPKDVSVLWSQADSKLREKIHSLHKEAVKESISYLG